MAPCDITASSCVCDGVALDSLRGRVFTAEDTAGGLYSISLCDPLTKEQLPEGCVLDLDAENPAIVRYEPSSPAGCQAVASAGPECGGAGGSAECAMVAAGASAANSRLDLQFTTTACSQRDAACAGSGCESFTFLMTGSDSTEGPGVVSLGSCGGRSAPWPTLALAPAEVQEEEEVINALYITTPFFLALAATAIIFVRRARAGTSSMPFGLPLMSAPQVNVFALCYGTYVLYHALRAGFSGCKSSLVSESGFTKAQIGNMDTAFLLAYAAGQFYWGSMADRVSAKKTVCNGMVVISSIVVLYTVAEMLGLSPDSWVGAGFFVLARAAEGFMQATGWSGTLAMTSDWFGAAHRGAVMGVMSTNANVGNILGEILVGSVFAVVPAGVAWQLALLLLAGALGAMAYLNMKRFV